MTPLVPQNLDEKGEITETNKSIQRELVSGEEERHSSQKIWRDTTNWIYRKTRPTEPRELKEAPLEEQSAKNKVIETAFRVEQAMEKMSLITKLLEVNLELAGQ